MANEVGKAYVSIIPSMRGFSNDIRQQLRKELAGVDAEVKGKVDFDSNQVARNAAAAIREAQAAAPDIKGIQVKLDKDGLVREVRTAVNIAEKTAPKVKIKTDLDKELSGFLKNIGGNPLRALGNVAEQLVETLTKGLTQAFSSSATAGAQLAATAISLIAVTGALIAVFLALAVVIGGVVAVAVGLLVAGLLSAAIALGTILPAAIGALLPAFASLLYIFDGFGKLLTAITEGDLKKFDKFLDTLTGKTKVFAEAFRPLVELKDQVQGEFFGAILEGFDNKLPAAISKFKGLVLDATKTFGSFAKSIIKDFSTVENKARFDRIFSAGKSALDALLAGTRPLIQALLKVADAGSAGFTKFGQAAGNVLGKFGDALSRLADNGTIDRILTSFSRLVEVAGTELVGAFEDLAIHAPEFINLLTAMLPVFRPLFEAIAQFLLAAGPGFVDFLNSMADLFKDPAFVQSLTDLGYSLGYFLEQLKPLLPYLPYLLKFFTGLATAAGLAAAALGIFLGIIKGVFDFFKGIFFGDTITQFDLLKGAVNGAKNAISTLGGIAKTAVANVVSAFRGISAVEGIIKNAMNLAKGAIRGASGFLQDAALAVTEDMLAGFRTAYQKVGSIGRAIVQGMAAGVRAAAQSLAEAAVEVVDNALKWAKQKAGIASPSKVWREEVGKELGFGTAEGIRLSTFDVVNASQQLMLDALRASQNASGGLPVGLRVGASLLDSDVPPGSDDDDPSRPIVLEADGVEIARVVDRGNAKRSRR